MEKLGFEIVGSGHFVPGEPVKNEQLARVMSTSDEWIYPRSGIKQRHYAPDGVGVSDLACEAAKRAIESANIDAAEIDYIVFATMTPDYVFPGPGALLGAKLGIPGVPALDIRQQCAAMLFGLQTIAGLIQTGAAKTILFVGAEAHAGFMPWEDWGALHPENGRLATPEARARADKHRHLAVLFGDGAGALIVRATNRDAGLQGIKICSDGRYAELLYVPGGGFRKRPYWGPECYHGDAHIPRMDGKELFKFAVTKLPKTARELCSKHHVSIANIDVFLAHQANQRINEYIRKDLGVPTSKLPSNIERFGNTSGATIPILIDEEMSAGRVKKGQLAMVLALGTGIHWGAALWRL
ncbi:MAG: 3-oxoacyl-ACP synthase [Polyangiaceae bacterium]|nr:3-oxoacyl-ACP synthase [Polyangiaceae bacterium]